MHSRFHTAFAGLSQPLQNALAPLLDDEHFPAMLTAEQSQHIQSQCGLSEDELAFALLPLAAAYAETPISHFNVGAIARGVSGNLWFGANMEYPGIALQQTVHAEQSAITHAWMSGETALRAITVNYTPCGHCRQFMNELNSGLDLHIHLPGRTAATLKDYLPDAFGPRDLDIKTTIFDAEDHGFSLQGDALSQQAIRAANRSHAPYTQSPCGLALELRDGTILTGSYAENAAFNPSLPPLQAALNLVILKGYGFADIQRAILAERADGNISQWAPTVSTLNGLGCQNVDRVLLA